MYGSWTTIATILNSSSALAYSPYSCLQGQQSTVSLLALGCLSFFYVLYVTYDLTMLYKFSRYTFTPYFILLWALAAILTNSYPKDRTSWYISAILLGVGVVGVIVKGVVVFWREKREGGEYQSVRTTSTVAN